MTDGSMNQQALRIIDANLNRAKEGLRVCEDVFRFVYDDESLTRAFKRIRHECSQILLRFPAPYRALVEARNSRSDVGRKSAVRGRKRPHWKDLVTSNLKRAQESLRVLEEVSKMAAPKCPAEFQSLRFKLYELEKRALKTF
jgi:thiamine-phosphate pyrophosphorylase